MPVSQAFWLSLDSTAVQRFHAGGTRGKKNDAISTNEAAPLRMEAAFLA
jgi:hypothetical protein